MFPTRRITTMGGDIFRDEYSIDFDGTNDYLDLGNTNDLGTGAFSFAFWIKVDDWTSNYIMSKREDDNNRWFFISNGSDQILFQCDVGGVTKMNAVCTTILTPYENQWVHLAFTSNRSGTNRWFINGKFIDTDTDSNSDDWDNSGSLYVNRLDTNYGSPASPGSNRISEIVRYNTALSIGKIATIYNEGYMYDHLNGVSSAYLKSWWRMGDSGLEETLQTIIADATDTTLGADIIEAHTTDLGSFDTDTTGNWSVQNESSWAYNSGTGDATFTADGSGGGNAIYKGSLLTVGTFYKLTFKMKSTNVTTAPKIYYGTTDGYISTRDGKTLSTSYQTFTHYFMASATTLYLANGVGLDSGDNFTVDDIEVRAMSGTPGGMRNMGAADIIGDTPNDDQ